MKVSLDIHDFSILNQAMEELLKIKEHFPSFKVSMFTIPVDVVREMAIQSRLVRKKELARLQENLDWIQIIPHGLMHIPREFENCDVETMSMVLKGIDEAFTKDGLPYEKGFCAPYWLWNQQVIDVLNENGWWGAVDRNQPKMLRPKTYYEYSHSLEEPFWASDSDTIKLHGHMDRPSLNAIRDCLPNILKLPVETEWHFVTDFLEKNE